MKYSWNIIEICYFCREENSVSGILVLSFKCALGILVGVLLSAIPAPVSPVSLSFLFPLLDSCVPTVSYTHIRAHQTRSNVVCVALLWAEKERTRKERGKRQTRDTAERRRKRRSISCSLRSLYFCACHVVVRCVALRCVCLSAMYYPVFSSRFLAVLTIVPAIITTGHTGWKGNMGNMSNMVTIAITVPHGDLIAICHCNYELLIVLLW